MRTTRSLPSWRPRWLWLITLVVIAGFGWADASQAQQSGTKRDRLQPIEIEADNLEIQQDKQLAIFAGNVRAVQGTLRLRAQILRVHYLSRENRTGEGQSIAKIDAIGKVVFSSETETAQGDEGVYDVTAGIVTLTGDVVLTRGESVIRGRRIILNLETGLSTVESGNDRTGGGGRVRGLFVPQRSDGR
ncbi:MAG: lipopolysaccharide transport periplasmic protein LptA [Proteobacteria bacterium]|nr:lipopolysaccharide transport periplasmic protein LptA [Pseudomonadota bacterium]